MASNSTAILLPLYIYPAEGAWNPLYEAIEKHPSHEFTVIINPASGPGAGDLPDSNWIREIKRLNGYENVRSIGYIAITYGKRDLDAAKKDIETYENWAGGGLNLQGIFVDEAPSFANDHTVEYVRELVETVRESAMLGTGETVFNPGRTASRKILALANRSVICEERYKTYLDRNLIESFGDLGSRESLVCILHSIPPELPVRKLKPLIHRVKEKVGTLFVTDLSTEYYQRFSPRFQELVALILHGK